MKEVGKNGVIAAASTVAVVVPSPATSDVLEATSRTIWAIGVCLNVPQLSDHAAFDVDLMHQGLRKPPMRFPERVPLGPDDRASHLLNLHVAAQHAYASMFANPQGCRTRGAFRRSFDDRQATKKHCARSSLVRFPAGGASGLRWSRPLLTEQDTMPQLSDSQLVI